MKKNVFISLFLYDSAVIFHLHIQEQGAWVTYNISDRVAATDVEDYNRIMLQRALAENPDANTALVPHVPPLQVDEHVMAEEEVTSNTNHPEPDCQPGSPLGTATQESIIEELGKQLGESEKARDEVQKSENEHDSHIPSEAVEEQKDVSAPDDDLIQVRPPQDTVSRSQTPARKEGDGDVQVSPTTMIEETKQKEHVTDNISGSGGKNNDRDEVEVEETYVSAGTDETPKVSLGEDGKDTRKEGNDGLPQTPHTIPGPPSPMSPSVKGKTSSVSTAATALRGGDGQRNRKIVRSLSEALLFYQDCITELNESGELHDLISFLVDGSINTVSTAFSGSLSAFQHSLGFGASFGFGRV